MDLPGWKHAVLGAAAMLYLAAALGCATSTTTARRSPRTVETLPDGSQVVCEQERPTGSHIFDTVCRTYSPAEVQRMKNQISVPRSADGMKAAGGG